MTAIPTYTNLYENDNKLSVQLSPLLLTPNQIIIKPHIPFIKHEGEKVYENFFNTIRFITQSHRQEINKECVKKILFTYISFCSWGISFAVRTSMTNSDDLINSFSSLLNGPYSENNLNKFLETLMNSQTGGQDEEIINLDMFKKMFDHYDISTVENVRDFLLTQN